MHKPKWLSASTLIYLFAMLAFLATIICYLRISILLERNSTLTLSRSADKIFALDRNSRDTLVRFANIPWLSTPESTWKIMGETLDIPINARKIGPGKLTHEYSNRITKYAVDSVWLLNVEWYVCFIYYDDKLIAIVFVPYDSSAKAKRTSTAEELAYIYAQYKSKYATGYTYSHVSRNTEEMQLLWKYSDRLGSIVRLGILGTGNKYEMGIMYASNRWTNIKEYHLEQEMEIL